MIRLRVDTLEMPDGRLTRRDVVEHPGAVAIVAIDDLGRVLLVRQYRHPTGCHLLELPAGTLEPGEAPATAAQRELREEVGMQAKDLQPIASMYASPGYTDEFFHIFFGRGLTHDPLEPDADEEIEVVPVPMAHIPDLIARGEIMDAKTVAGLLLVHHRLALVSPADGDSGEEQSQPTKEGEPHV
ncbi:MAG: NUDIX hydrolase [Chloroflexi bacterium]|nr:NUDIX hydrolase [Chloroflexota bacterium]